MLTDQEGPSTPAGTRPTGTTPTRVLWLIKGLGTGGAETLLLLWARARDRRRFAYETAFVLPRKTALVDPMRETGVPVSCLDGGREWDVRWLFRLRRLLRERRPDSSTSTLRTSPGSRDWSSDPCRGGTVRACSPLSTFPGPDTRPPRGC